LGTLGAILRHARNDVARIVGVAVLGAVPGIFEESLASRAKLKRGERRLLSRVLERQDVAFLLAALGGLGRSGDLGVTEAGKGALVLGDKGGVFRGFEESCSERVREGGEFFIQLFQLGFVGVGEIGARADEGVIGNFEETQRLRIEMERFALFIDACDAGEEFCVQGDGVLKRGQLGRQVLLDFLKRGIGICRGDSAERVQGSLKELASFLHGDKRVFEGWRSWVFRDGLHLF
jgi:hypothetical protein